MGAVNSRRCIALNRQKPVKEGQKIAVVARTVGLARKTIYDILKRK